MALARPLSETMLRLAGLVLLCVIGAIIPLYYNGVRTDLVGRDFTDIWLAGHAARAGINASNPAVFEAFGRSVFGDYLFNWPYPPTMLFLAVPISFLPHALGFFIWDAATMALFYFAAKPFLPRELELLAVVTPAAILSLIFGQTGFVVGALWFFAFRWAPASALLLIKPHMGVLAGLRVLTDRKKALVGIAIGLAIVIASALIFGGWREFFLASGPAQANAIWNRRWITWVLVATAPGVGYGIYGWLLFAIGAAWFLRRDFNVWTAATATMLISPYGYHYDMTVICAGLMLYLYERKLSHWETAVLVIAFLSPAWVRVIGTWFVPPVLLTALAVQTRPLMPKSAQQTGRARHAIEYA
jgi:hypothetical protein